MNKEISTIFIETPRLIITPYSVALVEEISKIYTDPQIIKYTLQNRPRTPKEIQAIIEKEVGLYKKFKRRGKWLVYNKLTQELMGYVGLLYIPQLYKYELSFAFIDKYRGNGYATEAATYLVNYAFKELKHKVLVAMVEKENIKCQRVLTKLGFKYQHDIELYGYVFELFKITSPAVI